MLEDGGILKIAQQGEQLQTTVEKMGIVVLYDPVSDEIKQQQIAARVQQTQSAKAHHKDNDFWHSPEFWGNVIGSAIVNAHDHDDYIVINSSLDQHDVENLKRYYKQ